MARSKGMRWPVLVLVAAVTALLTLQPVQTAKAATLTVGQDGEAVSLDPPRGNDIRSLQVIEQIYDTLVVQGEDLELQPALAESWEQLDDRTWEFRLRSGVVFHNGEPFTAADVKFTYDRILDPDTGSPVAFLLGPVKEVEVVDDLTVRIRTEVPFAPIVRHLAHPAMSILNEKAVREAGDNYGTRVAVGTGPFRFVEWVRGSHIVLERNPDWWGGDVLSEKIVFRIIPDDTVRAIELETGGVDIAFNLDPIDRMRLEGDPNVNISVVETASTTYIGFNVQKPPFDDVRVRRAIAHAIDVDPLVDVIYEGMAVRARAPLAPKVFGAQQELEPYEYNPERARQLLAEAGYPNGFSATIWTDQAPLRVQSAEVVQENLRAVGITARIQVLEWGAYLSETAAGKHDMFILGWSTVTADADYGLFPQFHSSQRGAAGNRSFYANPRVDELLELGRASSDPEVRLAAYREVQEIIWDEVPVLFLMHLLDVTGLRANVEGFVPRPNRVPHLDQVTKR